MHWGRTLLAIAATACLCAVTCSILPDLAYQRFQLLDGSSQRGVRWIYERTEFNRRPIDVAIIGSSRIGAGVNAGQLARGLVEPGCSISVVNFSIPEEGRNLHWILAKQLISTKHPKLLLVGVIEQPSRSGNPGFKFVAPVSEMIDPAYVGNLNYLEDIAYLPFRQLYLWLARFSPGGLGLRSTFDPANAMAGPGEPFIGDGPGLTPMQLAVRNRAFLAHLKRPLLPNAYADLEFGDERVYIGRIAALAKQTRTRLLFVYMPHFGGPPMVEHPSFYRSYGPLLSADFLPTQPRLFYNLAHVNAAGQAVVTEWLVKQLRPVLSPCSSGEQGQSATTHRKLG